MIKIESYSNFPNITWAEISVLFMFYAKRT